MGILKLDATFVVTDYNFQTTEQFSNLFENSESCKEFVQNFSQLNIGHFKINDVLVQGNYPKPIIIYRDDKKNEIRYNHLNKRLEIISQNYSEDQDKFIKELLITLSQFKLQEISYIGFNFILDYDKENDKLNIFNSKINEKFPDFPKNIGFSVTLPIDLSNEFEHPCIATYEITKISIYDGKNHVYRITANYNFSLNADKGNVTSRLKELQSIIEQLSKIYNKFSETYIKVIEL